jgi:hypothetical protein
MGAIMVQLSRRDFVVAGFATTAFGAAVPHDVLAQAGCLSLYVPARLSVDCASRKNFSTFRKYSEFLCLAGVVSVTAVAGKYGKYPAGNLFLFPCLKPKAKSLPVHAYYPTSATESNVAGPGPSGVAPDEYLCRSVLQASAAAFIGLEVHVPFDRDRARRVHFTNIDKLADGLPIGVNWTSSNLNGPYFGGSRMIPASDACNGAQWRHLILEALKDASRGICT